MVGLTLGEEAALGEGLQLAPHPRRVQRRRRALRSDEQRLELDGVTLFDSYHCSRYNTNTGRPTTEMFEAVFAQITDDMKARR